MKFKETLFLPDFIVIGAGKSGTTSLDNYLGQHPDIFMAPVKEPNFLAYHKLPSDYPIVKTDHYKNSITELVNYLHLFENAKENQLIGEVSNTTMIYDNAIKNIKDLIPETKIIAILRQPAERLFSRYLHLVRDKRLPSDSIDDLFNHNSIWWKRPDLIPEGYYCKNLKRFYQNFDQKRIKICFYEDLKNNPQDLINSLLCFLEVSHDFQPNVDFILNKSGIIQNQIINKLVGYNGILPNTLKRIDSRLYNDLKKHTLTQKLINKIRNNNLKKIEFSLELKKKITSIYQEDIKQLEQLTNMNLSHWYKL